ncbi:MAG: SMP-30/gluconolactonase/LRE family protein [Janthinobacterium lividum]
MDDYEIIDPVFRSYVLKNASLELLASGFRWLEGPVWFGDQQTLLFSDLPNDRVMRWNESSGASVFRQPSAFANGHARDRQGRLISCSHRQRNITRTELDGSITVLADHYLGKRLNSPNDVVVKSDGSIWFTDPPYGIETDYEGGKQEQELPARLYRLSPDGSTLDVMCEQLPGPNGLCFSPDETRLYVSETGLKFDADPACYIAVLEMADDGKSCGAPGFFHQVEPGNADGLRADQDGNLWASAADGVHCISPAGKLLGKIKVPFPVSNLAFGGPQLSRLFICASHSLFAIHVNQRGLRLV